MCEYLEYCTREQLIDFYGEFDATEETVQKDVEHLKEWMQSQPHLPNITDDLWLGNVLLRCKNDLEKTKAQLDCYYTSRAEMPDIFSNRDPRCQDLKNCVNVIISVPARCLTPEGYRITFAKISEHVKEDLPSAETMLKAFQIQADVHAKQDRVRGVIIVVDFEHISIPLFTLSMTILRRTWMLMTFEVWEKAPSELTEVLPSKNLPSDYGGEEQSLENLKGEAQNISSIRESIQKRKNLWYNYLTTFHEWFAAEEKIKADLTKKPSSGGVTSFIRNMFGAGAS